MKILAIGAHPDDIEIFMYGLLSVYKKIGHEINLCVATDGSRGNVLYKKNIVKIRSQETLEGLKKLGNPKFLNLKDGFLESDNKAENLLIKLVADVSPDLIITHAPNDYHPDHRALSRYIDNISGFKVPVIYCETLMGINFIPEFYVDITCSFQEKLSAILKHKSQRGNKFANAVRIMNRFRAAQCNAPENFYAESYAYNKNFPFSDIRSYLPESPKIRKFYSDESDGLI